MPGMEAIFSYFIAGKLKHKGYMTYPRPCKAVAEPGREPRSAESWCCAVSMSPSLSQKRYKTWEQKETVMEQCDCVCLDHLLMPQLISDFFPESHWFFVPFQIWSQTNISYISSWPVPSHSLMLFLPNSDLSLFLSDFLTKSQLF